ncbi:Lrp/AsnC family transcriptional regulator [Gordonia sp. Z-3]|uniref:Lrp/AsnC family transcriptional regulator n=1 Tax=Gordonia aquimaris TaxID=2984863 RepID=A0A9X3I3L2_9ACTN|nr:MULTISPECIES: Lrp/AsnC family transcriptional regulator [Gordonia]MAU80481.1 AsnC family transcriptional regulator [Gordonia sp. (in: high G+C Gram-positive bacteria)]MCX2962564.1 Lrp/AsnC family transcriptional regulator [Gordonia aquimaris]MED5801477.1 Lrp/AsnC family transcriptional regulator [Gordonia sp. Z-3]
MRELDELDEKVLACLTRDARATYAQIGDVVGLSAPAVKRRVDRLVEDGVVKGFTIVIDPYAMQWTTEAYVQVSCRGNISPQALKDAWEPIPEVVSAATITGQADAILRVRARDVRHLEQALERIRSAGPVDHSESIIVLSQLIDRGHP